MAWMKPKTKSFPIVFKATKSSYVLETIQTYKLQEIIDFPKKFSMKFHVKTSNILFTTALNIQGSLEKLCKQTVSTTV